MADFKRKGDFMNINLNNLMQALPIAGKGMLGIFVVIGIIMLVVALLNFFSRPGNN